MKKFIISIVLLVFFNNMQAANRNIFSDPLAHIREEITLIQNRVEKAVKLKNKEVKDEEILKNLKKYLGINSLKELQIPPTA